MDEQNLDATQVINASVERTMLQSAAAGATQMGQTIPCAVCGTPNTGLDIYCRDCGFLLASVPGTPLEGADAPQPRTLQLTDRKSGRTYPLRPGVNTVGRESADVMLLDSSVSRRHAEITLERETAIVVDLGSTNGSQIDGAPLEANRPRPARAGAELRFGSSVLVLDAGEGGAAAPETAQDALAEPVAGDAPPAPDDGSPDGTLNSEPAAGDTGDAPVAPGAVPPAAIPAACLRSLQDDRPDIPLPEGAITIGRRAGNDVMIPVDPYVSGRHLQVQRAGDAVEVTDLGSTNGTTLAGVRMTPSVAVAMSAKDEIVIGRGRYRLEFTAPPDGSADGEDVIA